MADDYDHLIKLLLLGDSAVGKSSLLMRFTEDKFEQNFVITIGVDFRMKTIERGNKKLRVQVWDTAGQERFRTITPAYYRSAMGVVMCYDITDDATFDNVEMWLNNLDQHGSSDVQKILIGNKSDLEEKRKVPKERGFELAAKHKMQFYETSAKTGDFVEDAFNDIADAVVVCRYSGDAAGSNTASPSAAGGKNTTGASAPSGSSAAASSAGSGSAGQSGNITLTAENAAGPGGHKNKKKGKCAC
ncbi:unnamed protein product [Amoebophrya sp. A120]|nr:unnamed protein product [Amoebophrya sp. A120]|eukprot:GSA120T00015119001.1